MSIGSVLVGLAIALVAGAYIARPFRRVDSSVEAWIEIWVRTIDAMHAEVGFCPQCGRQIAPEHRFCPGCGARLHHEDGAA